MELEENQQQQTLEKYDCLIFDVDDTLYPLWSGLSHHVTENIKEYMIEKLGIEKSKVLELCAFLYKHYGTTLAGLRAVGHKIDYNDFHSFVHGRLPYDDILKTDHVLRSLLHSLPFRKIVFTNADKAHASRVLSKLGLEDCFEQIICFDTLNNTNKGIEPVNEDEIGVFDINEYSAAPNAGIKLPKSPVVCKPFEEAFEQAFKIAGINPQKTLFFDDSIRNLQTGKRLGLTTVWVGSSLRTEGVDCAVESIHNINEALPELWETNEKFEGVKCADKVAIETSVKA
ncbi:uncharacterized protein C24B11.05-like [Mercurialis annua]|uniref:uncharacterized protein C24B11.05-like n=1 Tax=Mercurialis annua TaxID=3986 RepID=UPI00215EDAC1|nr:uncharacterized protein C24B11.05-like [Mercurialis annua]